MTNLVTIGQWNTQLHRAELVAMKVFQNTVWLKFSSGAVLEIVVTGDELILPQEMQASIREPEDWDFEGGP